jgi:hypothetical protein
MAAVGGYSNLEYDVASGARGSATRSWSRFSAA